MILLQPNIERMTQLALFGMAKVLEEQRYIADVEQLGFADQPRHDGRAPGSAPLPVRAIKKKQTGSHENTFNLD